MVASRPKDQPNNSSGRYVKMSRSSVTALLIFVALATRGGETVGHHAATGYDKDRPITLQGVVTEWRWQNPHVFLIWTVTGENGETVEWSGELASPRAMTEVGLTRLSFKAGDEVIADVYPASNGSPQSIIRTVSVNGKLVVERNPLAGGDLK
jgi:hypothetical protein